jgi:DNA-binding LacI/PurR family transcriptional regulator
LRTDARAAARSAGITSPKFDYYDEIAFYPMKDRMKKKSQRSISPKPVARRKSKLPVEVVLPFDAKTHQSVSDPFFVSLMGSLADALTARGYDMLVSRIDAERLDLAGDLATSGRAIGVILVGQWHHHEQINDLAARQSPIVVWGAHLPQQFYCTIGGDNIAGGRKMAIKMAHHQIRFPCLRSLQ